jgi:large subunit ribosomal protein L13
MLQKHPDDVIRLAVRRMLPKTKLGSSMLKRLKVYSGPEHPHTYAKPEKIEVSA